MSKPEHSSSVSVADAGEPKGSLNLFPDLWMKGEEAEIWRSFHEAKEKLKIDVADHASEEQRLAYREGIDNGLWFVAIPIIKKLKAALESSTQTQEGVRHEIEALKIRKPDSEDEADWHQSWRTVKNNTIDEVLALLDKKATVGKAGDGDSGAKAEQSGGANRKEEILTERTTAVDEAEPEVNASPSPRPEPKATERA